MTEFGCDYCRDDQNRLFGHVTQLASDETRQTILLRCPRCSALYENTPDGPDQTRRLSESEARSLFPEFAASVRQIDPPSELSDAVTRFIAAQHGPCMDDRTKALSDIGVLLEGLVRQSGLADDSLVSSLDGLAARTVVVTHGSTCVEISGAFYTLVTREGGTGELMLPVWARLSVTPGTTSTIRVADRASRFEQPQSEGEFQRAFNKATWANLFELRLA